MDYPDIEQQKVILNFVRAVIESELTRDPLPAMPDLDLLGQQGACFVTLHDGDGQLRGCIGNIEAFEPLGENLMRNAVNAAFSDPRFPPLEPGELAEIRLEVSILTPPQPIADPLQFVIGSDGIIMKQGSRSAVFLPQVAPEQGWDQRETLRYLSLKAGLPADGWTAPGTTFQTFRAIVFGE